MEALTERQQNILLLVVQEYIDTAQPVSSGRLVRRFGLPFSSATVRNELAALTEMGYLHQPHTSAGRVPTERGYRAFVAELLARSELRPEVRESILAEFVSAGPDPERWAQVAAAVLAQYAQAISLVTAPHAEQVRFKRVELIAIQGRQALMVLVLTGGEVLQRVLTLPEPASQERLRRASDALNRLLAGKRLPEIRTLARPHDVLAADSLRWILQDLESVAQQQAGEIYLDGLSHVLATPEFNQGRTLRLLEERESLRRLLAQTTADNRIGGVQVLIGAPQGWDALQQCALVLARYGVPGQATGALGVVGPMRMPYSRAIPAVRYVAGVLSHLMTETILGDTAYEQEETRTGKPAS